MTDVPWGPPEKIVLSEADRRILHDVKESCSELMSKLTELDTYIDTLNSNARQFDGEQFPQP